MNVAVDGRDMTDKPLLTVECEDVEFSEGVNAFGDFANAFRLVPEGGPECFLDFCVYSAQEEKAQVVSRVRVHRSFLPILHARLQKEMELHEVRPPRRGLGRRGSVDLVMSRMKGDA